jgi:hypothetical protein
MRYVPYKPHKIDVGLALQGRSSGENSVKVAKLSDAHIRSGTDKLNVNSDDISGTSRKVEAPGSESATRNQHAPDRPLGGR